MNSWLAIVVAGALLVASISLIRLALRVHAASPSEIAEAQRWSKRRRALLQREKQP